MGLVSDKAGRRQQFIFKEWYHNWDSFLDTVLCVACSSLVSEFFILMGKKHFSGFFFYTEKHFQTRRLRKCVDMASRVGFSHILIASLLPLVLYSCVCVLQAWSHWYWPSPNAVLYCACVYICPCYIYQGVTHITGLLLCGCVPLTTLMPSENNLQPPSFGLFVLLSETL